MSFVRTLAQQLLPLYKFLVYVKNEKPIYFGLLILALSWVYLIWLFLQSLHGQLRVVELWIYPIKGCAGIQVESCSITKRGIKNDRLFAVVNIDTGKMVTQRQEPRMTLISTAIRGESLTVAYVFESTSDKGEPVTDPIAINIPLYEDDLIQYLKDLEAEMSLGIHANEKALKEANPESIERFQQNILIWTDKVEGIDCGPEAAAFLDAVFPESNSKYRLVRMKDSFDRRTFIRTIGGEDVNLTPEQLAVRAAKEFGSVSMADARPILLANRASLKDLNRRLVRHTTKRANIEDRDLEMIRFRPNIVVDGCRAWEEDSWNSLQFASLPEVNFFTDPCSRCKVPTNDPYTGEFDMDDEPNATLKTFHSGGHIGQTETKKVKTLYFGMHLDHGGRIDGIRYKFLAVGDLLTPNTDAEKEARRKENMEKFSDKAVRKLSISEVAPLTTQNETESIVELVDIDESPSRRKKR